MRPVLRRWIVVSVSMAVGAPWGMAEEPQKTAATSRSGPGELVSLKFGGGTIGQYVQTVREAARDVNIVLASPDVKDLPLPPVQLTGVGVDAAVGLLRGNHRVNDQASYVVDIDILNPHSEGGRPVYKVSSVRTGRNAAERGEVKVWSVSDLISSGMPSEAVLTAVETALSLLGDQCAAAQLRFHEATAVLVAFGEPQQLDAIARTIAELRQTAERQFLAAAASGESIAGLFDWIERMKKMDSEGLVAEIAKLRDELKAKDNQIRELESRLRKPSDR